MCVTTSPVPAASQRGRIATSDRGLSLTQAQRRRYGVGAPTGTFAQ